MRNFNCLVIWIFSFTILTGEASTTKLSANGSVRCYEVQNNCENNNENIPWCIEQQMRICKNKRPRQPIPGFFTSSLNSSSEAWLNTDGGHEIRIPSEALQKSSNEQGEKQYTNVDLIVSVFKKTFFVTESAQNVHRETVLGVWLGVKEVYNLSYPVKLRFRNTNQSEKGVCVYWHLDESGQGNWSTDGCSTKIDNGDFVCICNHLSFFAVLISPDNPGQSHIAPLNHISYIGSVLSMLFAAIIFVMFLCQRKRHCEHSVVIHVQLTSALFLLHLSFLCSIFFMDQNIPVCQCLGILLHLSFLATFTWTAIEGFHLYLLLVRVFNIYIKRYLLKLSLVGWGVPTITVIICCVKEVAVIPYGKYTLDMEKDTGTEICFVTSKAVRYITVNGYIGLVLLFNMAILGVVVVKMHQLKAQDPQHKRTKSRMWKNWASLLGLSCVLGLPWGMAAFTYGPLTVPALYIFTILNSFQGVFIFLWFLTLTCKAWRKEPISSQGTSKIQVSFHSNEEHLTTR